MISKSSVESQPLSGNTQATNGAKWAINTQVPYISHITICGTSDLLFHAWNTESVEEKGSAAKGSEAKKSDDLESYVYRNEDGLLCFPAEHLRMSIAFAAKSMQDPRSPRKSAFDLCKASIAALHPLSLLINASGNTTDEWDFVHKCRVRIQQNAVTRCRPAFHIGWSTTVDLLILTPEYLPPATVQELATQAGRLIGVGDFRPTYGRFRVTKFEIGLET
jgi:hypothetical protein